MAKDPAVLFYTSDFISGTITMTDEERGRYILLLCLQHQKGKLTDRDIETIKNMPEVLLKFEKSDDGFYYNIRMKEEAEKRKSYSESRRNNRKTKTYQKDMNNISSSHQKDMNNISKSYLKDMENENENENVNKDLNVNVADKLLDELLDITTYKKAKQSIKELGGIDVIFSVLNFDESQKQNWLNHIKQKESIFI
jgi:uncharacterized protein YdaU (DUF1376 family)